MKTAHLLWYVLLLLLWDSLELINSPLYSTTKSPFLKGVLANTPRPSAHTQIPLHCCSLYTYSIQTCQPWNNFLSSLPGGRIFIILVLNSTQIQNFTCTALQYTVKVQSFNTAQYHFYSWLILHCICVLVNSLKTVKY